jgi:Spy/CpxP family protein refolding chaperone
VSSRTKAALIVAVAFVAGLFVGIAGDRAVLIHSGRLFPRHGGAFAAQHVVDHLDRQLHLSDAQRTAIQRIVNVHHARIQSVWDNVRPQVRREIDATTAEIESVLTPQQRATFREMRNRGDRRRHGPMRPF